MLPQVVNRKGQTAAVDSWNQAAADSWNDQAAADSWNGQAAADSWNGQAAADSWNREAAADSWNGQAAADSWNRQTAAVDSWNGQAAADSWNRQAAADSWNGQAAADSWNGQAAAAADNYYSNPGILCFHNHMDQQNQGMMHSHCNLVKQQLFPHQMNQKGGMLHSGHLEHFLWVAVSGNHIGKWNWNQEESRSGWSYDRPGERSMIWLLTQLLGNNKKMSVLGLHQLCVDSEKKNTNTNYVNVCSNQETIKI